MIETELTRVTCGAKQFIPAGVHVSPMHLCANEQHHVCERDCLDYGTYVVQHADVHQCRCGVSFEIE